MLTASLGYMTSSSGPTMQLGALLNRIGSVGISWLVSFAWSAKLSPMAMKLREPATGAPIRAPAGASGSASVSSARIIASDSGDKVAPVKSDTKPERSRIMP